MSMTELKHATQFPEVVQLHCPRCLRTMVPIRFECSANAPMVDGHTFGTVVFVHPPALHRNQEDSTSPCAECGLLDAEFSVTVRTRIGIAGRGRS